MPAPYLLTYPVSVSRQSRGVLCLSNSGFLGMIAIAGLSPDRDGGKRAGHRCLPLDSRSTQLYSYPQSFYCFALMPQLAAVLYQVSGIIDFRRGRRNRCRRGWVMPRWQ